MTGQEPDEARRKRLRYRAWHRGTREMDLILGPFADAHLDGMASPDLDRFEDILERPDQDLYRWITGAEPPPDDLRDGLMRQLLAFDYKVSGL